MCYHDTYADTAERIQRIPMLTIDTWRGKKAPENQRAFMGWGGLTVTDDTVDILDMLRAYYAVASGESCGQCFPCRSGLRRIATRLDQMCQGQERADDLQYLGELAAMVRASARCDIGQTSPQPLLDVLEQAPQLLKARKTSGGAYTSMVTAPCVNACPGHVTIPEYIEDIRFRRFDKGLERVMNNCPMPGTIGRVCERPCEAACKRGLKGKPVAIRNLKRFLFDHNAALNQPPAPQKPAVHGKKVAIIGGGPAGLSCAYYLAHLGAAPTIFERHDVCGGMAKFGIPDFRLPPSVLTREINVVAAAGSDIRTGVEIGRDISVDQLHDEGFEAIFIGAGAPHAPGMRCEGEDSCPQGYLSGIHYLHEATMGRQAVSGTRLVVVGGGNVAMDCARTALRHGFKEVRVVYRRTEAEMPADPVEIEEAREEGTLFTFLAAPLRIENKDGRVTGLVCQKMELGPADDSGRRRPVPVEGADFELPCDAIVYAIGQKVALEVILKGKDGALNKYRTLDAHDITGEVSALPRFFGGGDCVTGPSSLIAALAAGKRAAAHITAHLNGEGDGPTVREKLEQVLMSINMLDTEEALPLEDPTPPMPIHAIPLSERLHGFTEVETEPLEWEAVRESSRCLRCLRVVMTAP